MGDVHGTQRAKQYGFTLWRRLHETSCEKAFYQNTNLKFPLRNSRKTCQSFWFDWSIGNRWANYYDSAGSHSQIEVLNMRPYKACTGTQWGIRERTIKPLFNTQLSARLAWHSDVWGRWLYCLYARAACEIGRKKVLPKGKHVVKKNPTNKPTCFPSS